MGWLFGHYTRKDLIKGILERHHPHIIKHCFVGNNMWTVYENRLQRFIVLFKLKGCPQQTDRWDNWGYKDVDECMYPSDLTCPLSYLDLCTEPVNETARDWRDAVRRYHADKKRKLKKGDVVKLGSRVFTIEDVYKAGYSVRGTDNVSYFLKNNLVVKLEVLTQGETNVVET